MPVLLTSHRYVHIPDVLTEEEMQKHVDPWFGAFLRREIVPEGRDLCDASGIHPQANPDEFTVVSWWDCCSRLLLSLLVCRPFASL